MTQCEMVYDYLRKNGCITQLEAADELGCWRLASRISDLRSAG